MIKWSSLLHSTHQDDQITCGTSNLDSALNNCCKSLSLYKHVVPCYLCTELENDMNVQTSKWCAVLHETKLSWRFYPEESVRAVSMRVCQWKFYESFMALKQTSTYTPFMYVSSRTVSWSLFDLKTNLYIFYVCSLFHMFFVLIETWRT